jgi:hypothetical protein
VTVRRNRTDIGSAFTLNPPRGSTDSGVTFSITSDYTIILSGTESEATFAGIQMQVSLFGFNKLVLPIGDGRSPGY